MSVTNNVTNAWWRLCEMYKDWSDDEVNSWREYRELGRHHFVMKVGVWQWGTWMFCVMSFIMLAYWTELGQRELNYSVAVFLAVNALLWIAAGYLYGWCIWTATEKAFHARFQGSGRCSRKR